MADAQMIEIINYIKTHRPRETDFETIDAAIVAVTGDCNAATKEDMVSRDDAWLIPPEEREKLAGMRGRGWAKSFSKETIGLLYEAVKYSRKHVSEYRKSERVFDVNELKEMKARLVVQNSYNTFTPNMDDDYPWNNDSNRKLK